MVLTLYGHPNSTCGKRAAVVLYEKNIPFNFVELDFANNDHKSPPYLKKQPLGKFHTSQANLLYLLFRPTIIDLEKYADQVRELMPKDLKKRSLFEQAASIEHAQFDPSVSGAAYEKIFKARLQGLQLDEKALQHHLEKLDAKLDVYDKILSNQRFLAGDELTLADLFHLSYGVYIPLSGSNALETKPNVARWWKEISELPSWIAVKYSVKSLQA
ncbi:glutathione S-transferase [Coprinopsis marcescibilis]|uniref:glutathione transferase n=1 Tax=Coprinopsis marcescibilis TaxID=230819 RepID=A0A5C3L361_COPMA|nr:glutathione S-transferase [Coprinopsis marcescibilis]